MTAKTPSYYRHLWNQGIRKHPDGAREDFVRARQFLDRGDVHYGGSAIPVVVSADFITPRLEREFQRQIPKIMAVLEKAIHVRLTVPAAAAVVPLSEPLERLVRIPTPCKRHVIVARLDGFINGEQLTYLETNADSPAGTSYADRVEEAILQTDLMRRFLKYHRVSRQHRMQNLVRNMLIAYKLAGGVGRPSVAILDWHGISTIAEFYLLKSVFEQFGCAVEIGDPREFTFAKGVARLHGRKIDLVYRRALAGELAMRSDEIGDLIRAAETGKVVVINPFSSAIGSSKALLALIFSEEFKHYFTRAERSVIARHFPYTFTVGHGFIRVRSKIWSVPEYVLEYQDQLVLKPAIGHGGVNVLIGKKLGRGAWKQALKRALEGGWVGQHYVHIPQETIAVHIPKLHWKKFNVNTNPFVVNGRYAGSLTRVSQGAVINVQSGGFVQATLTLQS